VVPLWNASPVTVPTGPCVTESDAEGFTFVDVCTMLLLVSAVAPPVLPTWAWKPSRWPGSRAFQIIGES
jgi:hypothetical protein